MADLIVVDASALYEVLAHGARASAVHGVLAEVDDFAAPELIDVEVTGLIRRDAGRALLDDTGCHQALNNLVDWPGERYPHRPFAWRVWELRHNVRTSDAYYVALAETLDVPLLTLDMRLAQATGPRCPMVTV